MTWQYTPYTIWLITGALVLVVVAGIAWQRRRAPGGMALMAILAGAGLWTFAYGMELASTDLAMKIFWVKVEYIGIVIIPTAWMVFAWQYAGRRLRLSKPLLAILVFIPTLALVAAWTNEWHYLFWTGQELVQVDDFVSMTSSYGPVFWLHWAYSNVLILVGMITILLTAVRKKGLYRRQAALLLLAALLPWVGNLIYLSGSNPFPGLDITSVAFAFSSLLIAWVVMRYRLLAIVPVAHRQIILGMRDALLVLDEEDRILDANPALATLAGANSVEALIGAKAQDVLPSQMCAALQNAQKDAWHEFTLISNTGGKRHYEVKSNAFIGPTGAMQGRIIHVRDISEHRAHMERLRVLRNIDQAILAARSTEEIANSAIRYLRTLIPSRRANVLLFDAEKHTAILVAEHADSPGPFEIGDRILIPPVWRALIAKSHNKSLLLDADSLRGPGAEIVTAWLQSLGYHSIVAIPLVVRDEIIGAMNLLLGEDQGAPTEETIQVAEEVAASLAVALDHARLAEELEEKAGTLEKRVSELEALYEISLEINQQRRLADLLPKLLDRAIALLDASAGALYLRDPEQGDALRLALLRGGRPPEKHSELRIRFGEGLAGQAALKRDVVMVSDYRDWDGRLEAYDDMNLRQAIAAPLLVGDQLLGALAVGSNKKAETYSEDEVRLLRLLAEQAATAIAGIRLLEAEQEQRELAETLKDISLALSQTQDIDTVLEILLTEVRRVVPYDGANILLVQGDEARIAHIRGYEKLDAAARDEILNVRLNIHATPNLRQMMETREPMVIADVREDAEWVDVPVNPLRSWVGAPIVVHDKVTAFFSLDKYEPDFYNERHAQRLAAFCGQAAIAFENIWLYQAARRRADLSARLVELGDALNRPLSEPEVIQAIGGAALVLPEADKFALYLRADETFYCAWRHNLEQGYIDEILQSIARLPGQRFLQPQAPPMLIADVHEADVPQRLRDLCDQYGHRSLALWPLLYEGRVIAVAAAYYREPHHFTPEEQEVMMAFARQAAVALENARLFEKAEKRLLQARTLQAVGALLTSELGLQQVLERILDLLSQVVEYDGASIQLLDESQQPQLATARGYDNLEQMSGFLEKRVSLAMRSFMDSEQPKIFLVSDAANDPRCTHPAREKASGSCVSAPLVIKNRLIGILNVDHHRPYAYDDEVCETIMAFANQAAIAIENARLYEDLQEALLASERVFRVVSHELRTPISIIHGYAELLETQSNHLVDEQQEQALSFIIEQSQQLAQLVDQLMAYHELERRSLNQERVDVAEWLQHITQMWERVMEEKSILLHLDLEPDLGRVIGDRDYLDRVLNNLLHNARKFTPEGGDIWVRAWPESEWVHIAVQDSGVGIAADMLDKLFEPFYQANAAHQRFRGLGLGLSLAREIITRHGGRIWAESEGKGKGATFIFTLPRLTTTE